MNAGKRETNKPQITIGVPSYEREKMLVSKVQNLACQTYKRTLFIISCNSKISKKAKIKIRKVLKGKNYKLYIQKTNLGAWKNFLFVLEKAKTPFFMWASDDDFHHPKFIETLLEHCRDQFDPILSMCGFQNVNANGIKYRKVKQIWEYFEKNRRIDAKAVIEDPELFGKANYIYGIWNTVWLKTICQKLKEHVCVDQAIVMAALLSNRVRISKQILFKKYNPFEKKMQKINFLNPERGYYFRLAPDFIYQKNILKVLISYKNPFHFIYFLRRVFLEIVPLKRN